MAEKTLKQKISDLTAAVASTDNHLHSITEKKSNKVNSFTAVTNAAEQYPTVKAVIDYLGGADVDLATKEYVDGLIDDLVGGAPGALDTLEELADALGDDANFAATVTNQIAEKANKNITITGAGYLSGGGNLTVNRTIDINAATKSKIDNANTHISRTDNPHGVTKAQVGLGNADNTSDMAKPVSTAQGAAIGAVQTNLDNYKDVIGHYPFPDYRAMYNEILNIDQGPGPVPVPQGPAISISSGWVTAAESRNKPLTQLKYYDGDPEGIIIGDKLYNDMSLNNSYNGNSQWHFTDNGKSVRVGANGVVDSIQYFDTGGGGDDTPPETAGTPIMISTTSNSSHGTGAGDTNVCWFAPTAQRYHNGTGTIKVNDKVYIDPQMTVPYNGLAGGGGYRMTNTGKIVEINGQGTVVEIIDCGPEFTPPETNV